MTDKNPLHPMHPALWVVNELIACGLVVKRLLMFTRASTLVLAQAPDGTDVVIKAGFGSNHVLSELSDDLRPASYGFYWYNELSPAERQLGRDDFRHEIAAATACSGIDHVVGVLRSGSASRFDWYVMPHFPEGSFRTMLGSRPNTVELQRRWSVLADVAVGLHGLHTNGVVHRDVYAENILLTSAQGFITDLGASRYLTTPRGPAIRGPEVHWAPEYLVDYAGALPSADVYSLGVLAYRATFGDIPRMQASNPSDHLAEVIAASLAREPENRPSMLELGTVLRDSAP